MEKEIRIGVWENGKAIHCCHCGKTKKSIDVLIYEVVGKIRVNLITEFKLNNCCRECYPGSFSLTRQLEQLGIVGQVKFLS